MVSWASTAILHPSRALSVPSSIRPSRSYRPSGSIKPSSSHITYNHKHLRQVGFILKYRISPLHPVRPFVHSVHLVHSAPSTRLRPTSLTAASTSEKLGSFCNLAFPSLRPVAHPIRPSVHRVHRVHAVHRVQPFPLPRPHRTSCRPSSLVAHTRRRAFPALAATAHTRTARGRMSFRMVILPPSSSAGRKTAHSN